jgi:hypothetical protein
MGNPIYLIIIVIIIPLLIWFMIAKYFLYPLFFKPKIKTPEIINFLNKKQCSFVEYKNLNKKERERNVFKQPNRLTFDSFVSGKSEYKIIGFSQNENKHKIYWSELQSWFPPFGKRTLTFIEEKDFDFLAELEKEYNQEIITVTDKCPACNSGVLKSETECKNCGLNLVAK